MSFDIRLLLFFFIYIYVHIKTNRTREKRAERRRSLHHNHYCYFTITTLWFTSRVITRTRPGRIARSAGGNFSSTKHVISNARTRTRTGRRRETWFYLFSFFLNKISIIFVFIVRAKSDENFARNNLSGSCIYTNNVGYTCFVKKIRTKRRMYKTFEHLKLVIGDWRRTHSEP